MSENDFYLTSFDDVSLALESSSLLLDTTHYDALSKILSHPKSKKGFKTAEQMILSLNRVAPSYELMLAKTLSCRKWSEKHGAQCAVDLVCALRVARHFTDEFSQKVVVQLGVLDKCMHEILLGSVPRKRRKAVSKAVVCWFLLVESARVSLLHICAALSRKYSHEAPLLTATFEKYSQFPELDVWMGSLMERNWAIKHVSGAEDFWAIRSGPRLGGKQAREEQFSFCDDAFSLQGSDVALTLWRISQYVRYCKKVRMGTICLDDSALSMYRKWKDGEEGAVLQRYVFEVASDGDLNWCQLEEWSMNEINGAIHVSRTEKDDMSNLPQNMGSVAGACFTRYFFAGDGLEVYVDVGISMFRLSGSRFATISLENVLADAPVQPFPNAICSIRSVDGSMSKHAKSIMTLPELTYAPELSVGITPIPFCFNDPRFSLVPPNSGELLAIRLEDSKSDRKVWKRKMKKQASVKIVDRIQTDAKNYLTTERTLFSWLGTCMFIALSGLPFLESSKGVTMVFGGLVALAGALVLAIYAVARWFWRNHTLRHGSNDSMRSFVDRVGPALAIAMSCALMIGSIVAQELFTLF